MKEYEYVLMGMEEYLCYYNAMVICAENYSGLNFPNAFDNFFEKYVEIEKEYNEKYVIGNNEPQCVKKCGFIIKREADFQLFLTTIENIKRNGDNEFSELDLSEIIELYYKSIKEIKTNTLESELLLYPFIIKKIRDCEENGHVC